MKRRHFVPAAMLGASAGAAVWSADSPDKARELRLVTLDPAHFHAAQLHAGPLPGFSRHAYVYAPVTRDLANFWSSVANLTAGSHSPDHWRFHSYAGADYLERMLAEKLGDVVVLSGRNERTLEYIDRSVGAGLHVLADKPWILEARDLPKLESVLSQSKRRRLVAYDCMTQRFDIAYQLQRELVNDPAIFGARQPGSASEPAVEMISSHFLLKVFGGITNLRPAWYFDIRKQGEALADIGTHVVDLTHWTLFPEQALDYRSDIQLLEATRCPTVITADEFRRVTGEAQFPSYLKNQLRDGKLPYYSNNSLLYTVRGMHVALKVMWEYESPTGNRDSMLAIYRGTQSHIAVRAGREQNYQPEVDITPASGANPKVISEALKRRLAALSSRWPGLNVSELGGRLLVIIPPALRINEVQHFLLLAQRFAGYVRNPDSLPTWEAPNMVAKYYITTHGVDLARRSEKRP